MKRDPRVPFYAGCVAAAAALILTGVTKPLAGACFALGGMLIAVAGATGIAYHFAAPEMPRQYVRLGSFGLVGVGVIFVVIGVGLIAG